MDLPHAAPCAQEDPGSLLPRDEGLAPSLSAPYDGWELDEQLRHIGRLIGMRPGAQPALPSFDGDTAGVKERCRTLRLDKAHPAPQGKHATLRPQRESNAWAGLSGFVAASFLLLGLGSLTCGSVLLAWSLVAQRADLWSIGAPVTGGGLAGLLVGLLVRLHQLRYDHERTAARVDRVHDQLHRLATTTTLLGVTQNSPSGAFYGHLADGASPQLLLADLKSQLDLLAVKIGADRTASP